MTARSLLAAAALALALAASGPALADQDAPRPPRQPPD